MLVAPVVTVSDPAVSSSFGSLPVAPSIARALAVMGYTTPTPIQEQAIPALRAGRDVLGQAQTGTGKTAGFGIPLIEALDMQVRVGRGRVQAIVLTPTRELCIQVADEVARLGQFAGVRVLAVYGGVGLGKQTDDLTRGVHIMVGTPGRVEDLMARGVLDLSAVKMAVLDEADRMLDVGFLPAIERILGATPKTRQTALFSATMPDEVRGLAHRQMRDPVTVAIEPERATVDEIEQRFEPVPDGDKLAALRAYLDDPACTLALVFRRTTFKSDRLTRDLTRLGYRAAVLHGRRTQGQRERVLADLKAGRLQVLVATDIAARGLDIAGLTHVFNYDLPDTPETYIHRIGRTGRAGEHGVAVSFIAPEDEDDLRTLERYLARIRRGEGQSADAPMSAASRNGAGTRGRGPRRSGSTTGRDRNDSGQGVQSNGRSSGQSTPNGSRNPTSGQATPNDRGNPTTGRSTSDGRRGSSTGQPSSPRSSTPSGQPSSGRRPIDSGTSTTSEPRRPRNDAPRQAPSRAPSAPRTPSGSYPQQRDERDRDAQPSSGKRFTRDNVQNDA